jgi:ribosomal protein L44E
MEGRRPRRKQVSFNEFLHDRPCGACEDAAGRNARSCRGAFAFWSIAQAGGLDRMDIKVLEVKTLQPDVRTLTLRIEGLEFQRPGESRPLFPSLRSGSRSSANGKSSRRSAAILAKSKRAACRSRPSPIRSSIRRLKSARRKFPRPSPQPQKDHKRVILVFGGNWCYDCHVLDATFRSKEFAPLVNANYHVIHINVGELRRES